VFWQETPEVVCGRCLRQFVYSRSCFGEKIENVRT
jgi:hypothetical protein